MYMYIYEMLPIPILHDRTWDSAFLVYLWQERISSAKLCLAKRGRHSPPPRWTHLAKIKNTIAFEAALLVVLRNWRGPLLPFQRPIWLKTENFLGFHPCGQWRCIIIIIDPDMTLLKTPTGMIFQHIVIISRSHNQHLFAQTWLERKLTHLLGSSEPLRFSGRERMRG